MKEEWRCSVKLQIFAIYLMWDILVDGLLGKEVIYHK